MTVDFKSFFNDYLKTKIVKIGPVMNSGGAAQNNRIFLKRDLNTTSCFVAKPWIATKNGILITVISI